MILENFNISAVLGLNRTDVDNFVAVSWLKTDVCEVRWKRQECMDIPESVENTHRFLVLMWGLNLYSGKSFSKYVTVSSLKS